MLEAVKIALRIKNTAFDTEIQDLIDAAKDDLRISGVLVLDELEPLVKRAIVLYCKAHFGYDNPDADRFTTSYHMLKNHLALSGEHRESLA